MSYITEDIKSDSVEFHLYFYLTDVPTDLSGLILSNLLSQPSRPDTFLSMIKCYQ